MDTPRQANVRMMNSPTQPEGRLRTSQIRAWLELRCSRTRCESSSSERPQASLSQTIARRFDPAVVGLGFTEALRRRRRGFS